MPNLRKMGSILLCGTVIICFNNSELLGLSFERLPPQIFPRLEHVLNNPPLFQISLMSSLKGNWSSLALELSAWAFHWNIAQMGKKWRLCLFQLSIMNHHQYATKYKEQVPKCIMEAAQCAQPPSHQMALWDICHKTTLRRESLVVLCSLYGGGGWIPLEFDSAPDS